MIGKFTWLIGKVFLTLHFAAGKTIQLAEMSLEVLMSLVHY
jgi:hypothetical protein